MMAEGGCVGAFALTEPNAGSDVRELQQLQLLMKKLMNMF